MITNALVLLFTAEDLAAMPNAIAWLKTQQPERVLVLVTPNVGITGPEVTREHDAKIAGLEAEKEKAKLVENFALAQTKKEEIEAAIMARDMALRDGWQKIPEAERKVIYDRVLSGFGTEPVMLREAYAHEEAFSMLNSYRIQWVRDIPFDEYTLIWPKAIRKVEAAVYEPKGETVSTAGVRRAPHQSTYTGTWDSHQPHAPADKTIITPAQAQAEGIVRDPRATRLYELQKMHHLKAIQIAKGLGVFQPGMNTKASIAAILEREFPPVPA